MSPFENYDALCDGRLSALLRELRDDGVSPTKAAAIVFRDLAIVVAPNTVASWISKLEP